MEDREIEKIIRKQEEIGLKLATDGEFRRTWWHFDFLGRLDGVEALDQSIAFQGMQARAQSLRVVGKVGFSGSHPFLEHFKFLKAHTKVTPKMTIPAPSVLHFRLAKDGIDSESIPTLTASSPISAEAYRKAVKAFYDAGCRYLQFDDTIWAYLCSQEELRKARERMPERRCAARHLRAGDQQRDQGASRRHDHHAPMSAAAISAPPGFPRAATSRSPRRCSARSTMTAISSNTTPTAPAASSRCGFLPKGNKRVVLGLVTSKSRRAGGQGRRSSGGSTRRRNSPRSISSACRPQCGFASTEEGNILAEDEQWAKLRMIVEIADEVWGK